MHFFKSRLAILSCHVNLFCTCGLKAPSSFDLAGIVSTGSKLSVLLLLRLDKIVESDGSDMVACLLIAAVV